MIKIRFIIPTILLLLFACKDSIKELTPEENEELMGGQQTIFNQSSTAFSLPSPGLTGLDELYFFTGNSFFNQNWVSAPASTTARDGLGPTFNSRSCSSCHFKDGRGKPPEFPGELATGYLVRLSIPGSDIHGEPLPDPNYGGQLNDQAIANISEEGIVQISYSEINGSFEDGTTYTLRKPELNISGLNYGPLDAGIMFSPRVGNQMIGLGLLEAISESTLHDLEDELDADGDGISGKINHVWDYANNKTAVGRFGWKANQPNLLQQVAGAFIGDLGITSSIFPQENCTGSQMACMSAANGGSPEIEDENLEKVTLYASNLAVPARRDWDNLEVLKGKQLFLDSDCGACHIPKILTGTHERFDHLSNQEIRPFTDLLLHDMGEGLADGRPDFEASGSEWRTAPLWGIGLFETVNGHSYYLHDGRARNLMEAILWHGGEAEAAKNKVLKMRSSDREALIKFLKSL